MAVIQPCKRRRATPEARPAEKGDGGWHSHTCNGKKQKQKKKGTMGKKVNWKELMLTDIEGNEFAFDARKTVGNVLFNMADDVAEHDLGVAIYHSDGEMDMSDEQVRIVRKYLGAWKYVLRQGIERIL